MKFTCTLVEQLFTDKQCWRCADSFKSATFWFDSGDATLFDIQVIDSYFYFKIISSKIIFNI